jgi:hypothetical protein
MIPGAALDDLVDKVKALDMAEVHRKIAEQEAEAARAEAGAEAGAEAKDGEKPTEPPA